MVDFVGLLKRTIDAQSSPTPALRRRIYDRTRETVEKQMAGKNIAADIQALQRRILEKAIYEVEAHCRAAESGGDDVFSALRESAGMKAAPEASAPPPAAARRDDEGFAAPPSFAAYPGGGESFSPAGGFSAAAGGNAYFARPPAAGAVMSEAAYGGFAAGDSSEQRETPGAEGHDLRAGQREDPEIEPLFQLDDEEEEEAKERRFSSYRQSGADSYPYQRFEPPAAEEDAFARRSLDEPVDSLPDFDDDFSAREAEPQSAPFPPYGAEQDTVPENFSPAPPRGEREFAARDAARQNRPGGRVAEERDGQNYSRDFSSLHNFLFGEAEREETKRREAAQADDYPPQSFDAPFAETGGCPPRRGQSGAAGRDAPESFSSLPDFLIDPPQDAKTGESAPFDFIDPNPQSENSRPGGGRAAQAEGLPENLFAGSAPFGADALLPEETGGQDSPAAGGSKAASIFAQSALREKRRSGKRRLITGGAVLLALAALLGGIFWFLHDFLHTDKHSLAELTGKSAAALAPRETVEKANQRLTADGREINAAPPAAAAPKARGQDAKAEGAPAEDESAPAAAAAQGPALFREAQTALMGATEAKGDIRWSLLREKTPEGAQDTALRGDLTVPSRDIVMRLTIRPNHDKSIPAVYLAELMFILPENFEGGAVDKISPILFKATAQSTGQELLDTRVYKISDNFFVVTLNLPQAERSPALQRNIALMEQLPWLSLNVAYKNGRFGEFTFGKGDKGDALFKQFFDAQSAENRGEGSRSASGGAAGGADAPAP